jgi:hypothetical protein
VVTADIRLSDEQEEVAAMLLECLALRDKWLFKPRRGPVDIADAPECACMTEVLPNPFEWGPGDSLPPGPEDFVMVDGIVQVRSRRLFFNVLIYCSEK